MHALLFLVSLWQFVLVVWLFSQLAFSLFKVLFLLIPNLSFFVDISREFNQ